MQNEEYQKDLVEKLVREARKADKEDQVLADAMGRLLSSQDFQTYLTKLIYPRIMAFGTALTAPAGSLDGLVTSEYIKGTLCGLCLARDLPSVIIQAMSEVRKTQENTDAS